MVIFAHWKHLCVIQMTHQRMRDRCVSSDDALHLQTGRTARSDGRGGTDPDRAVNNRSKHPVYALLFFFTPDLPDPCSVHAPQLERRADA